MHLPVALPTLHLLALPRSSHPFQPVGQLLHDFNGLEVRLKPPADLLSGEGMKYMQTVPTDHDVIYSLDTEVSLQTPPQIHIMRT